MTQEQINVDLFDQVKKLQHEVRELEAWKESAMMVLGEWEIVWEAVGKPGRLGVSKAVSVREYLDKAMDYIIKETQWAAHFPRQCHDRIRQVCEAVKDGTPLPFKPHNHNKLTN